MEKGGFMLANATKYIVSMVRVHAYNHQCRNGRKRIKFNLANQGRYKMKKSFIIIQVTIILCIFISCTTYRNNSRSYRSKYFYGYIYDKFERKPIYGIRIYPKYCPPEFCTEAEIAGGMTDESGYFKIRKPNIPLVQFLVIEFEETIIDSVFTLAGGLTRRATLLFLDRKRADTIMVNMTSKTCATFRADHRR
ncbi:MAG: hypothetical protein LBU83_06555 [Bacteroidales bacterium]|jgi:hypothetical protein|nr:hypothetical protein [Bacteroidales bacterium]